MVPLLSIPSLAPCSREVGSFKQKDPQANEMEGNFIFHFTLTVQACKRLQIQVSLWPS